ncbi:hypothetical protein QBC41DRAFT_220398 [Cercophora samala]|uniref:Secreted protein n=1 Tax=Cercophora samala TaxID=330535 RepID=A0AA39ZH95_9PEZI|nr:hypothetical protein QBC41DRAFT_220398 [Cercophora samala]
MKLQLLLPTLILTIPPTATAATLTLNQNSNFPSVCTQTCRKALHYANAVQGWGRRLCAPGSDFISYKFECWVCIAISGGGTTEGTEFEDVGRWCEEYMP